MSQIGCSYCSSPAVVFQHNGALLCYECAAQQLQSLTIRQYNDPQQHPHAISSRRRPRSHSMSSVFSPRHEITESRDMPRSRSEMHRTEETYNHKKSRAYSDDRARPRRADRTRSETRHSRHHHREFNPSPSPRSPVSPASTVSTTVSPSSPLCPPVGTPSSVPRDPLYFSLFPSYDAIDPSKRLRRDQWSLEEVVSYFRDGHNKMIYLYQVPPVYRKPVLRGVTDLYKGVDGLEGELIQSPLSLCDEIFKIIDTIYRGWPQPSIDISDEHEESPNYVFTFVSFRRNLRFIINQLFANLRMNNRINRPDIIICLDSVRTIHPNNGAKEVVIRLENVTTDRKIVQGQRYTFPRDKPLVCGLAFQSLATSRPLIVHDSTEHRRLMALNLPKCRVFCSCDVSAIFDSQEEKRDSYEQRGCNIASRQMPFELMQLDGRKPNIAITDAYPRPNIFHRYIQCFFGSADLVVGFHDNRGLLKHVQEYTQEDLIETVGGFQIMESGLSAMDDVLEWIGNSVLEACRIRGDQFDTNKMFRLRVHNSGNRKKNSHSFMLEELGNSVDGYRKKDIYRTGKGFAQEHDDIVICTPAGGDKEWDVK